MLFVVYISLISAIIEGRALKGEFSACHLKSEGNCYRESSRGTVPVRAMPRIAKCVKPARFLSLRFLPLYLINSHSHPFSLFARYLLYLTHLPHLVPLQLQRSVRHENWAWSGEIAPLLYPMPSLLFPFPPPYRMAFAPQNRKNLSPSTHLTLLHCDVVFSLNLENGRSPAYQEANSNSTTPTARHMDGTPVPGPLHSRGG